MTLRSGHLSLSASCDTDLLSFLARDISLSPSFSDRNVMFYPSFSEIVTPPQGMASACILFKDGVSLLDWMGVRYVLDRQGLMWKASCTKDVKAVRVMGGCQWDEMDDTHHMAFFPGKSCGRTKSKSDEVSERRSTGVNSTDGNDEYLLDCLFRPNAFWNRTSQKFISPLQKSKLDPRLPRDLYGTDIHNLSAFLLTWKRADSVSQKKWSSDAILTGDITIGTISLEFPAML